MNAQADLAAPAKTMLPQIHHEILPRKGITRIIDNASRDEVVFIVAPYGFGKTLAVVSWLRERELQAAWLNLDKKDNSRAAFLTCLTSAVLPLLQKQAGYHDLFTNPEYMEDQQSFLQKAASEMTLNNGENILVIDNFHFISDRKILRFIKDFIYSLLINWRVIIISRAEVPSVFNDLMLKRHICLITSRELSFSLEETADYFKINRCVVPEQSIKQLQVDTEGWPAALNVILTVSRGGPVGYGEAARNYITIFFETEVWDNLNENIKDFLLKTSILETLTPSSCHAMTGIGETLPILRWLFLNGLFISKLDEKDAYRYHRVFRQFLLDMLQSSRIDEQSLYKKFAWWLYERNEIEQSFLYFFKAGDLYGLSQGLRALNLADIGIEKYLELTSCITELDATDMKPYPIIVARMALIYFLLGNVSKMQSLYHIFLKWNDTGELQIAPEDYAEYMWEAGWLCFLDPAKPTRANKKNLEWCNYRYYVPHLKELHLARGAVLSFPSFFRGLRDYGDDGLFDTEPILEQIALGENILVEEESIWKTYLILAEYSYELENFAKAEEIIRRIMTLVEDRRYTDLYFNCTTLLIKLVRAVHDPKEIDSLTARLEALIMKNKDYFLLPNFHAFEQRNHLAVGQHGFTEVFEQENKDYADKPYFYLLYRHVTLVRVLLSTGDYSKALLILGNIALLCDRYNRPTDLIEANILKAIAFYGLDYEENACRHLMEALTSAKRYGYIRIFSDDAKYLWPILDIVRKQMKDTYVRNIIISCKKTLARAGIKNPGKKYAYSELTKTELKILKSLQSGMSYREIALDNNIRMSTVKSHVHSIYLKLEVDNKTSAVIAAQNMGILET